MPVEENEFRHKRFINDISCFKEHYAKQEDVETLKTEE